MDIFDMQALGNWLESNILAIFLISLTIYLIFGLRFALHMAFEIGLFKESSIEHVASTPMEIRIPRDVRFAMIFLTLVLGATITIILFSKEFSLFTLAIALAANSIIVLIVIVGPYLGPLRAYRKNRRKFQDWIDRDKVRKQAAEDAG